MTERTFIAGVDIGGTKMAVCLADAHGLIAKTQAPMVNSGADTAAADLAWRLINELCAAHQRDISQLLGIGVAACGPFVKLADGTSALAAPNLCGGLAGNPYQLPNDWANIPVEQGLKRYHPNVKMAIDCIAALQAERIWGAAHGLDNTVYATWSTGIGFGLCVDGHLLYGKNANAGHAGHLFVEQGGDTECGCGNRGDIESQLSGKALARRWGNTAEDLFNQARAGNAAALAVVDWAAERFAITFYNLVVTLDLQRCIIGGSVFAHNQDLLLPRLRSAIFAAPRNGLKSVTAGVDIVPAVLGDKVGDWGGLSLVMPPDWQLKP